MNKPNKIGYRPSWMENQENEESIINANPPFNISNENPQDKGTENLTIPHQILLDQIKDLKKKISSKGFSKLTKPVRETKVQELQYLTLLEMQLNNSYK
jgi:hypothetical protein